MRREPAKNLPRPRVRGRAHRRHSLFHSLGIRARLLVLVAIPMVVLVGSLFAIDTFREREDLEQYLTSDADAILRALDQDFERMILLNDQRVGVDLVVRLESFEDVETLALLDAGGEPIFFYEKQGLDRDRLHPWTTEDTRFHEDHLDLARPLGPRGHRNGGVYLRFSTRTLDQRIEHRTDAAIVAALISLAAGTVLALRLQRSISAPLLRIVSHLRKATSDRDYSTRIATYEGGEIGTLAAGIDDLLDCIREREADLVAAMQQALAASQAKGEFLANMSHEIRTPMNAIIAITPLLEASELTEQQHELVGLIQTSGMNLLTVINDILDFSKLEAGKQDFEHISFDPREVTDGAVGVLTQRAEEQDVSISVLIDQAVPAALFGDPSRLHQVLVNLLSNAVKFTNSGCVVVRVSAELGEGSRATLSYEVEDTGMGIPADKQAALFQPFSQADSSTTRLFGGTGLGLTICKKIVEAMGGEIGLESEQGVGSTFRFTAELELDSTRSSPGSELQDLAGRRVLCCRANHLGLEALGGMLRARGARVRLTPHLAGVLELARGAAPSRETHEVLVVEHSLLPSKAALQELLEATGFPRLVLLGSSPELRELKLDGAGDWIQLHDTITHKRLLAAIARLNGRTVEHERGARPSVGRDASLGLDILLVEDNPINQRVATLLLDKLGCQVQVAANGSEAVSAVTERRFDVILMDCQMPIMDGYAATREIRALQAGGERTPIIALTAHAMREELDKCLEAGMDDYLTKPIDAEALRVALEKSQRDVKRAG